MADAATINWGNIDVEFDASVFDAADVEAASRKVEARLPGFAGRVPAGSLIVLSRHAFSGEYVGAYQVGAGRPHEVELKARNARNAAAALLSEIASQISALISPLRLQG